MAAITVHARPRLTALKAGWLFDGTGAALRPDPVVILDGAKIVTVAFGEPPPPDADLVDLGSATLLPGLIDTHVHLAFDASEDPVDNLARRGDDEVVTAMRRAGRTALTGGVTTVRDLGDRGYLSLGLRGEPGMPTLVAAGPPMTTPNGHCHFLGGAVRPGVEGVRAAVREHVDHGVDVIKIMASGGNLTPGSAQHLAQFTVEELRVAVEEAHRNGLAITAHAHATAGIRNAIAAGVDGIEHASFWSEDGVDDPGSLIELIVERRIAIGATVGSVPAPGALAPPEVLKRMPMVIANMQRMQAAGVIMVAGSDAGIAPVKPHDVVRTAVPQLTDLGMSTLNVLRTLTSLAAEVCGLADRKGRIAPGFDADLLVVDGNPVINPAEIHQIKAVYQAGDLVDRAPS